MITLLFSGFVGPRETNAWVDTGGRPRGGIHPAVSGGYGQQAGSGRGDFSDMSSGRQQQDEWNRRFSKQGGWDAVHSATQAAAR